MKQSPSINNTPQLHTQSQSLNNTPYKLGGTKAEDVYIANSIQNIYYTPQKRTQSQNNTPYNTLNTHTQSYISSLIERNNGNQFGSISADENVNYNNRTKGYLYEYGIISVNINTTTIYNNNIINIISVINFRVNYTMISLPNPPNDNQIPAIESSYQFLYIITHTKKRYWCKYLLETKNILVRECFVDCCIYAIKCLINIERPLYYLKEMDIDNDNDDEDYKHDDDDDDDDEIIKINRNKKDEHVKWFKSGSVIVHLLDEMCRNILLATNYWRRFHEFWLFFKLFAELGNEEKQLLLDRHLIIECYRFYNNKKPYEYGLKQLILDEHMSEKDAENDELIQYKIKYDRRKMGSNDSEPNVSNMIHMLSLIICSCCPPNLKNINSAAKINKFTDIILPYSTMELSISSNENKWCELYISDKKLLSDCKIWMKFLEDNQNTNCLSNIISHLSWKNIDFSKKICKQFVNYLEEYHDNVYESCFNVCKSLLLMNDYIEEKNNDDTSNGQPIYNIKIYTHIRCDRFLTPTIKMIRDWYRDNKYIQSVAKIAQFIDDLAQNNIYVANYFRIKSNDIKFHII